MDSIRRPARRLREALGLLLAATLLFGVLLRIEQRPAREPVIRDAIAHHLLDGVTEGRQALVSSVWWAPLPSLLRVPLAYVTRSLPGIDGALWLASFFALALAWALYRFCRRRLSRIESGYLVLALVLTPGFIEPLRSGATVHWNVLLALALLCGYHGWRREHSLRTLVLFGTAGGLAVISGVELLLWSMIVFGLLAAHELGRRAPAAEKRATLLLAALPGLYSAGLWVLLNWLIMGAPLHFLRTWTGARLPVAAGASIPVHLAPGMAVWMAFLLLLALTAVICRQSHVLALVAAALAWVVPLRRFGHAGLVDIETIGWLSLTVSALAAVAVLTGAIDSRRRRGRLALCLLPLLIVIALRLPRIAVALPFDAGVEPAGLRHARLDAITAHVARERDPYVKIYVAGFEALQLLSGYESDIFQPALDFEFYQAARDYVGHRLYVLIHRPEGPAALDAVHARYPGVYRRGGPITLYDSDWGPWRLYEMMPPAPAPE